MKLKEIGERNIIKEITKRHMSVSSTDDCALIEFGDEYFMMSTDLVSELTNIPAGSPPALIGEFAASINLSDIAAMAGIPLGLLISVSANPDTDDSYLYKVFDGMSRKLREFDTEILGGDTKEGSHLSLACTSIGRQKKEKTLLRSNIRPKQILCVTGKLGRASSGYIYLKTGYNISRGRQMMMDITPRIREAQIIAEHGGRFMTDLSDGLFSAISQLKNDFSIGAKVVQDEIPGAKSVGKAAELSGASELDIKANFGGDYELLFTIENSSYGDFKRSMEAEKIPVSYIGETWEGENMIFNGENWSVISEIGYEHFKEIPKLGRI